MATREAVGSSGFLRRSVTYARVAPILTVVILASVTPSATAAFLSTKQGTGLQELDVQSSGGRDSPDALLKYGGFSVEVPTATEEPSSDSFRDFPSRVEGKAAHASRSRRRIRPLTTKMAKLRLLVLTTAVILGAVATLLRVRCHRYFSARRALGSQSNITRRLAEDSDDLKVLCGSFTDDSDDGGIDNLAVLNTDDDDDDDTSFIWMTNASGQEPLDNPPATFTVITEEAEREDQERLLKLQALKKRYDMSLKTAMFIISLAIVAIVISILALGIPYALLQSQEAQNATATASNPAGKPSATHCDLYDSLVIAR